MSFLKRFDPDPCPSTPSTFPPPLVPGTPLPSPSQGRCSRDTSPRQQRVAWGGGDNGGHSRPVSLESVSQNDDTDLKITRTTDTSRDTCSTFVCSLLLFRCGDGCLLPCLPGDSSPSVPTVIHNDTPGLRRYDKWEVSHRRVGCVRRRSKRRRSWRVTSLDRRGPSSGLVSTFTRTARTPDDPLLSPFPSPPDPFLLSFFPFVPPEVMPPARPR